MRETIVSAAVVGMAQRKRPLTRDPTTGKWMAEGPDRHGVAFTRLPGSSVNATAAIDSALRLRTLDEMGEARRTIIKAAR